MTRVLLPISLIVAVLFLLNGMPSDHGGKDQVISLQEIRSRYHGDQ